MLYFDVDTGFTADIIFTELTALKALIRWDPSTNVMEFQDRDPAAVQVATFDFDTGALDLSGALTAASYGGITEANLLDKTANETITGDWTFETGSIGDFVIDRKSVIGEAAIAYANNDGVKGYVGFNDAEEFVIRNAATSSVLTVDGSGNLVADGDLSGSTIGGIAEANLLDKTADETVSGRYTFTATSSGSVGAITLESASPLIRFNETDAVGS